MLKNKNVHIVVFVVLLSIFFLEFLNTYKQKHPVVGLNTTELVKKYGYPIETHEVVTEDGYILTLHRIPYGRETVQEKRVPVFFAHGLMQSSINFVLLGPGKSLALLLADKGFDVWLGNARGTTWSKKHVSLDPKRDRNYWDFSLHEIGVYDVKSSIDYILNTTSQRDLHYVGFSQGTITFFILTSERPEYAKKVKLVTALAPAMFLTDPPSFAVRVSAYFRKSIEILLLDILDFKQFFSNDCLFADYLRQICNENSIFVNLCLFHTFSLHGFNPEGANKTMLSLIYAHTPAGSSTKQVVHILQLFSSENFHNYDLGISGNLEKYGQNNPPNYDLSKAITPVALYYSSNDWTVNIKNIEKIKRSLPNVVKSYHVPFEKFNHDDFIHSMDAPELVYESAIEEILNYT